jgi:O-antigen/teichoic acid export membrane protein
LFELVVAKVVSALAGVVFVTLAANYFAPEVYGKFAIVFATSNLLVVISSVWIAQSVMRFTEGRFIQKSMGSVVLIALAIAAILAFGTSVFPALSQHRPIEGMELILAFDLVALTLALSLNVITSAYAIALQRYRVYRIAEVCRALLLVISVSVVATLKNEISGLLLSYALTTAIPSVILLVYLRNATLKFTETTSLREILVKYMHYGWPMTIWAALQAIQSVMERSVLSRALSVIDFGHFMAVNDVIVRGIGLMLLPVVTLIHSQLMASSGHDVKLDDKSKKLLTSGIILVLLGGAILACAILVERDLLGFIAPGIRGLNLISILAMCISAVAWVLALIIHKPLELRKSTLLMSVLLGAAIGLQWMLLNMWVETYAELTMPLASFCAAVTYMLACMLAYKKLQ